MLNAEVGYLPGFCVEIVCSPHAHKGFFHKRTPIKIWPGHGWRLGPWCGWSLLLAALRGRTKGWEMQRKSFISGHSSMCVSVSVAPCMTNKGFYFFYCKWEPLASMLSSQSGYNFLGGYLMYKYFLALSFFYLLIKNIFFTGLFTHWAPWCEKYKQRSKRLMGKRVRIMVMATCWFFFI